MAKEVKIKHGTTDLLLYKYDGQNNLKYDLLYIFFSFRENYYRITRYYRCIISLNNLN